MELIYTSKEIKEMDAMAVQKGTQILSLVEKAGEAIAQQFESLNPGVVSIFC